MGWLGGQFWVGRRLGGDVVGAPAGQEGTRAWAWASGSGKAWHTERARKVLFAVRAIAGA
jgi:hypothetical protein